ncbi:MAG: hypothetical protein M1828_002621 [Chrysothrix sp. TS-e1954]|nr:MAG: hypothetical protein M1828_002621 [Chrysothrix sp. TS-e1954]
MGKVHGSLARAGKVKSQTPKVEPQEKKKTPKGRAKKRITYTRRFVNVTMTGGKRKGKSARDVITLFHKPSLQSSTRVLTLLKQTAATASETATIDQASDHTSQNQIQRSEFDLDITEAPPTSDQLSTIIGYVGAGKASKFVKGATSESDALKLFKQNADAFQRPVIVDWTNGMAVAGENQSEILKMLNKQPEDSV